MRLSGRVVLALTLLLAVLVPAQIAVAEQPDGQQKLLTKQSRGETALKALGAKVEQAAAVNGLSKREFAQALAEDPTLWVGRDGRMFFVDPVHDDHGDHGDHGAEESEESHEEPTEEIQSASASLADTFLLHSRPGSNHTIYLDFTGVTLAPTSWWVEDGGMAPQTFTGYSQDGNPAFNDAERTFIQQVWRIVAEKYAAFDVNVTTEDLGLGAVTRTNSADQTWGTQVVITSDDDALAQSCGSCAGRALINVFDATNSAQYQPAWVFTDMLGTAVLTANAAAHEIGHTLGLYHDGTATSSYYYGHNHWVPIMGITTSKPVAQFSKGEYSGADNTEDDLAIIATSGAPLRPDDAGNTIGTATALPVASSYQVNGVIGTATDKDVYAVSRSCVNDLTATATGVGTGQTVDLKVTVYDSDGEFVGANDPASGSSGGVATGMNAEYTVTNAAASTYYIEVDGVGSGGLDNTPNPFTGYTDYGSIGQYTLAITGCVVNTDPPSVPQNLTATPSPRSTNGAVSWSAPASIGGGPITGYTVAGLPGGTRTLGPGSTAAASTSLVPGTTYAVSVRATNAHGTSPAATVNLRVPTWVPSAAPVVSTSVTGSTANLSWTAPANPGNATLQGYTVVLTRPSGSDTTPRILPAGTLSTLWSGIPVGTYGVTVTPLASADDQTGITAGTSSFTVANLPPSAPRIGTPSSGVKGGAITAISRWAAPSSTGGSPITSYRVIAYKLTASDKVAKAYYSKLLSTSARKLKWTTLPAGKYRFRVVAYNALGTSPKSAFSLKVLAQ